jgi:Glycosyl transferase family 2
MPPRRCAALTIVKDEAFFLPLWLRYFSQHFAPEDMYVLDHDSSDRSTEGLACQVERISNGLYFDHAWLVRQVKEMQRGLLRRYEYVLFCEADEIVVPDLRAYRGLNDYLAKLDAGAVRCTGYELIHDPSKEPPIVAAEPILRQRSMWFRSATLYSKPAIAREVLDYKWGFHAAANRMVQDPALYMVHLHRLDYTYCRERHEWKARQTFKDDGPAMGWQHHVTGTAFDDYYFGRDQREGLHTAMPIPEWIKEAL